MKINFFLFCPCGQFQRLLGKLPNTSALDLSMEVKASSQFRYPPLVRADGVQRKSEQHVRSQPERISLKQFEAPIGANLFRGFPLDGQPNKAEESHPQFPYQSPLTTSREYYGFILRPTRRAILLNIRLIKYIKYNP